MYCLLLVALPFCLWAQTDSEKRTVIYEVQRNYDQYLRGDVTDVSADKALDRAMAMLLKEIDDYSEKIRGQKLADSVVVDLVARIEVSRGDQFRAFVYVKKTDIPLYDSDRTEATPAVASSPKQETPKEESPKTETVQKKVENPTERRLTGDIIEDIKNMTTLSELRPFLIQKKEVGEVLDYNRYSALADGSSYYVVLFDREGNIKALLSPGQKERINLKTNTSDSLENYGGYGAIAVLLSKKP